MSSAPGPEFVEAIAAWALKDAARRSLVEAVERALADYGSPKIGTDEYVSVRHAAVVKSTTARLDVSWPAEQPATKQDEAADAAARLRGWFEDTSGPMVMDEADFDDVETVLADYGRVVAENERMRQEVQQLLSGSVPRSLSLALACVACHDCVGVFVTKDVLDRWAMDNGWRDGLCPECRHLRNEGSPDA